MIGFNLLLAFQDPPMKTSAWIFMLTVWAIVLIMTVLCFWKLMSKEHLMEKGLFEDDPENESDNPPGSA